MKLNFPVGKLIIEIPRNLGVRTPHSFFKLVGGQNGLLPPQPRKKRAVIAKNRFINEVNSYLRRRAGGPGTAGF